METGDTHRLLLVLHYDGSGFHGWQVQPGLRTVQGELQDALGRLAGSPRTAVASGRTDTGVHALGQVVSVDLPVRWTPQELRRALNAVLPRDIWVQEARVAAPDFHPRYDAVARTYEYRLGTAPGSRSPFHRRWCWALARPVEAAALREAAAPLPGPHSFRAFAKAGQPERGERCVVREARWEAWPPLGLRFVITADRYLHHMVRYLVGTMVEMARGRRPVEDMQALLSGAPGVETSPPAPPEGLFLARVEYPDLPVGQRDASAPHAHPTTIPLS